MNGWMDWLRGRLFSFPEDPVNRKPLSVRAAAGQVRAAAGQPSPAAKVHLEALFKNAEIGCSGHPQGGYSSPLSRAAGPSGPVLLGSTRRRGNLGLAGPFSPPLEAQRTGDFPLITL